MALWGIVKARFLRLWTRAPRTRISSTSPGMGGAACVGSDWAVTPFSVASVVMCINKKLYAHASSGANGPKRRGDGQSPSEGRTGQPSVPIASHAPYCIRSLTVKIIRTDRPQETLDLVQGIGAPLNS